MRLVLDTNVIIAAFASRGLCSEIFEVCLQGHNIIISEHILAEVREKLNRKIHLPKDTVISVTAYLRDIAELVEPQNVDVKACRDADDVKIIGTALAGKAEFIITGDGDLLSLKKYRKIEIITPRELWNRLSSRN